MGSVKVAITVDSATLGQLDRLVSTRTLQHGPNTERRDSLG